MNELDEFYKYAERHLKNYKRPDDWETRMDKIKKKFRKPMLNQLEGRRGKNEY